MARLSCWRCRRRSRAAAPAPPWFRRFPETNVRTYVVGPDGREGLWFFSLDAARLGPVLVARSTYALPYIWSAMTVERDGSTIRYRSRRRWPGPTPATSLDGILVGPGGAAAYRPGPGWPWRTEHFPDTPNQPGFPSTVLRPGQVYQSATVYRFSVSG